MKNTMEPRVGLASGPAAMSGERLLAWTVVTAVLARNYDPERSADLGAIAELACCCRGLRGHIAGRYGPLVAMRATLRRTLQQTQLPMVVVRAVLRQRGELTWSGLEREVRLYISGIDLPDYMTVVASIQRRHEAAEQRRAQTVAGEQLARRGPVAK